MPLRRTPPQGLVRPQSSRSPARPISLDKDEFPFSYHGDSKAPHRSRYSSVTSNLSAQSSPGTRDLIGSGSVNPMYGDPFRDSGETERLVYNTGSTQVIHPDPSFMNCNVAIGTPEADDWLHAPEDADDNGTICTWRGLRNVGCLAFLGIILLAAIIGGPVYYVLTHPPGGNDPVYYLPIINATTATTDQQPLQTS